MSLLRRFGLAARLEVENAVADVAQHFGSSSCGEVERAWLDEECLLLLGLGRPASPGELGAAAREWTGSLRCLLLPLEVVVRLRFMVGVVDDAPEAASTVLFGCVDDVG